MRRNNQTRECFKNQREHERKLQIWKRFLRSTRHPVIFAKNKHQEMNYQIPLWLDDIKKVTKKHRLILFTLLEKLQEAAYRGSKKTEIFLTKQLDWGMKLAEKEQNRKKKGIKGILYLKPPTSSKELKAFSGEIQNYAKFLPTLLQITDHI